MCADVPLRSYSLTAVPYCTAVEFSALYLLPSYCLFVIKITASFLKGNVASVHFVYFKHYFVVDIGTLIFAH